MKNKSQPKLKHINNMNLCINYNLKIMKHLKLTILGLATILMFVASCEKNKTDLPVEFKFVLLDTLGNEKTVFNQGENIIFSFQVINNSSEDLFLEQFLPNNDFFRVYQLNTDESTLDYGFPQSGVEKIGGYYIISKSRIEFKFPWVYSNNTNLYGKYLFGDQSHTSYLPGGNYYTEFFQSFKIGDIQTEEKHFKINFTVK